MLSAIILAIATIFLVVTAERVIESRDSRSDDEEKTPGFFDILSMENTEIWKRALLLGLTVGAVAYVTTVTGSPIVAFLSVLAMFYIMAYLILWWVQDGTNLKEFICFVILELLFYVVTMAPISILVGVMKTAILISLLKALPLVALLVCVGWFAYDGLNYYAASLEDSEKRSEVTKSRNAKALSKAVRVGAIVLVLFVLGTPFFGYDLGEKVGDALASIGKTEQQPANVEGETSLWSRISAGFSAGGSKSTDKAATSEDASAPAAESAGPVEPSESNPGTESKTPVSESDSGTDRVNQTEATPTPESNLSWYGFYNLALLTDDDKSNDFNFGWNCYDKEWKAENFDAEFRKRIEIDPALGAADMAWLDCLAGTRYIGVFYDECNGAWDAAINRAKEGFMADQGGYNETVKSFFAFLDKATKVQVRKGSGITDQMYMNPFSKDGIPDVIVMKTDDHKGYFLVYTFSIKGKVVEVAYRIDCGFQPCNVVKAMKIKPTKKPTNPSKPSGGPTPKPSKPTPTPKPSNPTPTPKANPTKNPNAGTNVGQNNQGAGAGSNTNTGQGGQHSSADTSTHTGNGGSGSYSDYQAGTNDMNQTNQNQQTGTATSKPSTTPAPGAAVHGGDGGNINTPTSTQKPVHIDTGSGSPQPISTDPAGQWGGPPD